MCTRGEKGEGGSWGSYYVKHATFARKPKKGRHMMYSSNTTHPCILFYFVFHMICRKHFIMRRRIGKKSHYSEFSFIGVLFFSSSFSIFLSNREWEVKWQTDFVVHSLRVLLNQSLCFVLSQLLFFFSFCWDNSGCREEGVKWQTALMQLECCSLRAIAVTAAAAAAAAG